MKRAVFVFTLVLIGTLVSYGFAEEVKRTARVVDLRGEAELKLMEEEGWIPLEIGSILNEGDIVRTKADSWLLLNLNGMGETAAVEVKEDSQLKLLELLADEEEGTQKTLLDLAIGKVLIRAKKLHAPESSFEVKTPTSIVGVRGTEFAVEVEALE